MNVFNNFTSMDDSFLDVNLKGPATSSGIWNIYNSNESKIGNRCYEYTWISGSQYFLTGFIFNDRYAYIFAQVRKTGYLERFYNFTECTSRLTISVSLVDSPVMICGSSYTQKISVIIGDVKNTIKLRSHFVENIPTPLRITMHQGKSSNSNDRLIFNYGNTPFTNKIPYGYIPWTSNYTFIFTKEISKTIISKLIYSILLPNS